MALHSGLTLGMMGMASVDYLVILGAHGYGGCHYPDAYRLHACMHVCMQSCRV